MSAELPVVQIPGYADALRREAALRRQAWANPRHHVCGIELRALTLRDMETLAELQNGFFCPWRFDSNNEFAAHCAQLVWWLSDAPKPSQSGDRFLRRLHVQRQRDKMLMRLARNQQKLMDETMALVRETFADAPQGGGKGGTSIASSPAYIADALASAGYTFGLRELLDTPLVQLWQILRVAQRRLTGITPTSESDRIACDYLAQLNSRN